MDHVTETIDPMRIRDFQIVDIDGEDKIQFMAIGDKHKMIRQDDGRIVFTKLPEQGHPYKYGAPLSKEDALALLTSPQSNRHHARIKALILGKSNG